MMLVPRALDAGLFGGIARALEERGERHADYREIRGRYVRAVAGGVRLRVDAGLHRDGTRREITWENWGPGWMIEYTGSPGAAGTIGTFGSGDPGLYIAPDSVPEPNIFDVRYVFDADPVPDPNVPSSPEDWFGKQGYCNSGMAT